ncbi:MAG: efflux RND transporter periplasmic adaptor subunit [Treponema sp.]|nr:efflux RND transporter periplasmic adaptor subunit [Treponema sp.]
MKNKFNVFSLIFLLLPVAALTSCSPKKNGSASYEFTGIRRGTLERTVSSSGTINPVATVKVLPQMSGKVEKINVDYNDTVRKGEILAELNTDVLKLKRDQQSATVSKARANYELQQISYKNQQALAEKEFISEFELKTSKTNLDNQAADLAVAEANLKTIETEINQYAYIKSPIDGIVLDRRINIGDTVVDSSSSNSSSIFTIAENLREMQIEAGVGELDVASIHKGQQVRFTLESFPGRRFSGVVDNLRMVPVVSSNVVSYTVIINVENRDGSLMPGMTCAVDFIVERAEDVLMVSNAALRYQPTHLTAEQISEMVFNASLANMDDEQRDAAIGARAQSQEQSRQSQAQNSGNGITGLMMGQPNQVRMPGSSRQRQGARDSGQGRQVTPQIVMRNLWYINSDGKIGCLQVRTGISDGSSTEIISTEDFDGRQVILRERI